MGNDFIKIKMKKQIKITILIPVLFFNIACTKKNENTAEVTGQFYFHLHTNIDDSEVYSYNSVIQSSGGRKVLLSMAQLYISNIELVKLDDSIYSVSNKVLLKDFENGSYLVGNVPAGNYKSLRFSVGLNNTDNEKTPVSSDAVFNRPEMWFGNFAQPQGYIFLNVQGKIDTSANADGSEVQMVQFVYKIGSSVNETKIIMPVHNYTILPDQEYYEHIIINYMKIFDGIVLSNSSNLSVQNESENSNSVAQQVVKNIPKMFSYE
jgi:hypothetical protein